MITPAYCQTMARYNAWQNHSLFMAANGLSADERERDRGAFFGSIQGTLGHLFWADMLWIARLDGGPNPDGPAPGTDIGWSMLMAERPKLDARIASWAWMVLPEELEGDLTWYSGFFKTNMTRPKTFCVMQVFNHQTHHRGQVHAMLTAAGARPDDTDLPVMPDEVPEWR